jgi:hypothetical protein
VGGKKARGRREEGRGGVPIDRETFSRSACDQDAFPSLF